MPKVIDSYILSQLIFSNEMSHSHGLEAWGKRFGQLKPPIEDWSVLTEEMIHRCQEDVAINLKLYLACKKSGWHDEALELEQDTYRTYVTQRTSQIKLNLGRAEHLLGRLNKINEIITRRIVDELGLVVQKPYKTFEKLHKKDGSFRKAIINYIDNSGIDIFTVSGPFSSVDFVRINVNSPTQVVKKLLELGWEPDTFTDGGKNKDESKKKPSLTKSSFIGVPKKLAGLLKRQSVLAHRAGLVKGLIGATGDDGVCIGYAQTSGCNTSRWKHAKIVNLPKVTKRE